MAFTTFANTSKVCMEFDWNGVTVTVCVHWDKASPTPADFLALATTFGDAWSTELRPNQTHDLSLGIVTAYDLSSEGAPKYVYTGVLGNVGAAAFDSTPNNTAAIISHRTVDTGRSARGRTYYPGLTENNVIDGELTASFPAALLIDWDALVVLVNLVGWELVVAQRFSAGVQLAVGVTRAVTSEIVTIKLGTQRRRQV